MPLLISLRKGQICTRASNLDSFILVVSAVDVGTSYFQNHGVSKAARAREQVLLVHQ